MNDIINKKTNRLHTDTFAAIQTVKYDLKCKNQTSISRYKRINPLRSPINQPLCKFILSSWKSYDNKLRNIRDKRKRHNLEMGVTTVQKRKKICPYKQASSLKKKVLKK